MSKTKVTKNIEQALTLYKPSKLGKLQLNYQRAQYMKFEVPVTHGTVTNGLVDCVWLAEGYTNHIDTFYCQAPLYLEYSDSLYYDKKCDLSIEKLKSYNSKDLPECNYDVKCRYKSKTTMKEEVCAIICFEIKVTKSDFHSKHGHNFIGNLNYYVMPYTLYKEVENEIPENIGVITYHSSSDDVVGSLKHQKPGTYNIELDYPLYTSLLHTFLNKSTKREKKLRDKLYEVRTEVGIKSNHQFNELIGVIRKLIVEKDGYPTCFSNPYNEYSCQNQWNGCTKIDECPFTYNYKRDILEKYDACKLFDKIFDM